MQHVGHCHCGAIGFVFETDVATEQWAVRACQCTFCVAHSALSVSDPRGRLRFVTEDAAALVAYQFGLRTAEFLLCSRCGVYIGARTMTPRGPFGIINLRALQPMPTNLGPSAPMSYEGETTENRASRRAERWTPLVE